MLALGSPSILALGWICSFFAQAAADASSPPTPTSQASQAANAGAMTGSIRAIEGGTESTAAELVEFDRTKRLKWDPGPTYAGVALDEVVATFRIAGTPETRIASVAVFEKLASKDASLLRPPTVVLTARGAEYRGVIESLSYQCTSQRCDVKVALLQGHAAAMRPPEDEEGWDWGPRE